VGSRWKNNHIITFPGKSVSKNREGIESRIEVTGRRGRRLKLQGDREERREYWKLKEKALDRTL
jgi:hypothetical protein